MIYDNVWFLVKNELLFEYFFTRNTELFLYKQEFAKEMVCVLKNGDIREHVGWTRGVEYHSSGPEFEVAHFIPWYGKILVTTDSLGGDKWIEWIVQQRKLGNLP
jgi:hypothetical protein